MKKNELYEPPCIERVVVFLEHAIAGSWPVRPADPDNAFMENWKEEVIITGDIEIM